MLVSFLANPAPLTIEIDDLILIALPFFLCILCLVVTTNYKVEFNLLIAIMLYCSYLMISILVGLLHGVPILNVLRAIGPYINFFPLLAISLLPLRLINPWIIALTLITIGTLQAGYQIYLYFSHSSGVMDTLGILRGRITLIDPRATLPIVLSPAILPFAFLSKIHSPSKMTFIFKSIAVCLILLGLFGGIVTLTRSIVLSIFVGWILFIILHAYQQVSQNKISFSNSAGKFISYGMLFIMIFMCISMIPKIHMLEQGLLARFDSSSFNTSDYSNGRIYDEWIPALHFWMNSDSISLFFGIGAGNTFTVATGEERSYIHNLMIYSLVYGGFFGLLTCLWLYITVFKTLVARAFQTHQTVYLGLAALLGSIFFYGQLFAVHKGLAFNAMLFLIIALALQPPTKQNLLN
jgi:hypothetical protein